MLTSYTELAARIDGNPLDGAAYRSIAQQLQLDQDTQHAALALQLAGRAFMISGHLPMAVVAAKELSALDRTASERLIDDLAESFGKASRYVEAVVPPTPPSMPSSAAAAPPSPHGKDRAVAALQGAFARLHRPYPLFHSLGNEHFRRLVSFLQILECPQGTRLIELNSQGETCYIIASGHVRISRPASSDSPVEVPLNLLGPGAFFGEMAILTNTPRSARATCEVDCILLELTRQGIEELATAEPTFKAVLADHTRERLLHNLALTSPILAGLGMPAREALLRRFTPRSFEAGGILIGEGGANDTLFVLASGQLSVEKATERQPFFQVAVLNPGDVVGEISVLTSRPATATVRATTPAVTLTVRRSDFEAIAQEFPAVLAHLQQLAAAREQDLQQVLARQNETKHYML
jgi:CRP-like cAMP-binding protein